MPLKSSLFTGTGPGFDRLRKCFESQAAHIKEGQAGPGQEAAVKLIQAALNQFGHALSVDGKFGRKTGDAVFAYKNSKSPKILFPGQSTPDRIVGIGTLTALDLDLLKGGGGKRRLVDPPQPATQPTDIVVHISGFQDPGGARVLGSRKGDGFQAHDPIMNIKARSASTRDFIALEGSLTTLAGVTLLVTEIATKVDAGNVRKIIIYGYSAGGSNAMEISRQIDILNLARQLIGLKPIEIDLMITVDAAERDDHVIKVNRTVGGSVKTFVNFFQTVPSPFGKACGAPARITMSPVTGRTASPIQKDCTQECRIPNLPKFSKHQQIEGVTIDRCVRIIDLELGV